VRWGKGGKMGGGDEGKMSETCGRRVFGGGGDGGRDEEEKERGGVNK